MDKVIVYTALFGNIDNKIPEPLDPDLDNNRYICFTNKTNLKSDIWEFHNFLDPMNSNRKTARFIKIMFPKIWDIGFTMERFEDILRPGDYYVWVDTSLQILKSPFKIIEKYMEAYYYIMAFQHPDRNQLEPEAKACYKHRGVDLESVNRQVDFYRKAGFTAKEQTNLTATGFFFRKHHPDIDKFNEYWWKQIQDFTERDQLSVDYCRWRFGIDIKYLPDSYRTSEFVKFTPHKKGT